MKFKINNKFFNFLFTCEHCIEESTIKSETEISLYFGKSKDEKFLKIKLDKKERFIKAYQVFDITMIQILKKDRISEDKFLLPDSNYLKGISKYVKKQIYTCGYPSVDSHKKEKHFSSGIIRTVNDDFSFFHSSDTRAGSSGSPIIDIDKMVIGIHKGANKTLNIGFFISPAIDELTEEEINKIVNFIKESKEEEESNEEEPKDNTNSNTFNQNNYINNLLNSSTSIMNLSQENITKFGILLNNPNYINYVKNYYSNPYVRENLKKDRNFQELLKINPPLKMMFDNPELIDKMFTQKMCNDMSSAIMSGNREEINNVDQRIMNIIMNNKNISDNNNN